MRKVAWVTVALLLFGVLVGVVSATDVSFTSSDSWEVPAGVTSIDVIVVGGGGGGGAGRYGGEINPPTTCFGGGGGGGGGSGYKTEENSVSVTPGQTLTITVGSGGSGGGSGGTAGSSGGASSITGDGVSVSANGGSGGGSGSKGVDGGTGGAGGHNGSAGSNGGVGNCCALLGGAGGSGGAAIYSTYGAGGGGGHGYDTYSNGCTGGAGYILITYTVTTPPVAAFSADVTEGTAPLTVTFTDSSTNDPTEWAWDIDNDGDTEYTTQNCEHTYSSAGTYSVKLTATNADGSDSVVKTDYITVTAPTPTPFTTLDIHQHYPIPPTPVSLSLTTNDPTDVKYCQATLNGNVGNETEVWFAYGFSSNEYFYATTPTLTSGDFEETIEGMPLIPNKTVYYRAGSMYGYGEEKSFVVPTPTTYPSSSSAYPTSTYGIYATQFLDSDGDWTEMAGVIWQPYLAKFGTMFFSIIVGIVFLGFAAKQGNTFVPLVLAFIIGIPIFALMMPDFLWLAQACIILGTAFAIYYIFTSPR